MQDSRPQGEGEEGTVGATLFRRTPRSSARAVVAKAWPSEAQRGSCLLPSLLAARTNQPTVRSWSVRHDPVSSRATMSVRARCWYVEESTPVWDAVRASAPRSGTDTNAETLFRGSSVCSTGSGRATERGARGVRKLHLDVLSYYQSYLIF